MENDAQLEQGRFTFNDIHRYLRDGCYPDGYTKPDKLALRKRAKFFCARGADLFYDALKMKSLHLFPPTKKPVQKCRGKHVFIHVYCICGLPESYDTQMIECEQCQ